MTIRLITAGLSEKQCSSSPIKFEEAQISVPEGFYGTPRVVIYQGRAYLHDPMSRVEPIDYVEVPSVVVGPLPHSTKGVVVESRRLNFPRL